MLQHVPNENPQSPDHHARERDPSDQNLAQRHLSRGASFRAKDGEVGSTMRADFCRLIDLPIALAAGIHAMSETFTRYS